MKRIFYILIFLLGYSSFNLFAQNAPPQELVWVCNYNSNIYYTYSNSYSDVGTGTWPAAGVIRYYNFDPNGIRTVNYTSNNAYACYKFFVSPSNESCRINGNNGTRGFFTYSPTNCPIDDYAWILLLIIGGTSIYYIKSKNIKFLNN